MKKKENKKFGFEKFEMAKLTFLKKVTGGTRNNENGNGNGDDDPGTITDILSILSGDKCIEDNKDIVKKV